MGRHCSRILRQYQRQSEGHTGHKNITGKDYDAILYSSEKFCFLGDHDADSMGTNLGSHSFFLLSRRILGIATILDIEIWR